MNFVQIKIKWMHRSFHLDAYMNYEREFKIMNLSKVSRFWLLCHKRFGVLINTRRKLGKSRWFTSVFWNMFDGIIKFNTSISRLRKGIISRWFDDPQLNSSPYLARQCFHQLTTTPAWQIIVLLLSRSQIGLEVQQRFFATIQSLHDQCHSSCSVGRHF